MIAAPALLALALAAPLLYLPGWLLARALTGGREAPDPLERIFERVLLGALLNGWLALTLAELGVFSIWLQLLILTVVCALAWLWQNRRTAEPHNTEQGARQQFHRRSSLALALILLAFALGVAARPFEVVLGVRDAGVYADTGFAIARTGGIVQYDPVLAQIAAAQQSPDPKLSGAAAQAETNFLGVQPKQRTIATRLRVAGFFVHQGDLAAGRVVPQGLHLFPSWIALLAGLAGRQGGLAATGLLGLLGLWSVAMLGRRLAGPWVGAGAALLLALNGVQVWFSRYSTAEAIAQFLTFAGLYCFAVLASRAQQGATEPQNHETTEPQSRRAAEPQNYRTAEPQSRRATEPQNYRTREQTTSDALSLPLHHRASEVLPATGHQPQADAQASSIVHRRSSLERRSLAALLCGLAFGQLALARIDFALAVAPAALYLFYCWLTRRWGEPQRWMGVGLALMLAHAAIHIVTIARAYFFDTLYARLQDYALTALIAYPFLTPELQEVFRLRPCSRIAIQPCPPVAGMPPTTFTGWNYPRILSELAVLLACILALFALRRWGQPLIARVEALLASHARLLLLSSALLIALLGAYAYLVRPQILTGEALRALPGCLSPAQLRAPAGACLALQGYVGAPITPPGYADPLAAWMEQLPQLVRGRAAPSPAECAAFRDGFLPPAAEGFTSVELLRDRVIQEGQLSDEAWARLQSCDPLVLRDLFAISQANLVRVGWYLSPLGIALGVAGLALWWRRLRAESWLFLAVALIGAFTFVRLSYGTSDQHYIYILRRYVPQVYPALALSMAYALARLGRWTIDDGQWLAAEGREHQQLVALAPEEKESGHRRSSTVYRRLAAGALGLVLVLFSLATNLKIYAHTEYAGALGQIEAIAGRFQPGDVILMRGGAPTFGAARDIPDNLAAPLTYAFGLNAFTVKSAEPDNYADALTTYARYWLAQGRDVYLMAGASGALGLPGLSLEPAGPARLSLPEFEQPQDQKPSNVQEYALDFQVYRVVAAGEARPLDSIGPDDYARQLSGFYRVEQIGGEQMAWTNGQALLRLPWPSAPVTLTLRLAPGPTRPASLGMPRVCLAALPEPTPRLRQLDTLDWQTLGCVDVAAGAQDYAFTLDLASRPIPPGGNLLLRIQNENGSAWIPARDDPAQHDLRQLGVLFGGLAIEGGGR